MDTRDLLTLPPAPDRVDAALVLVGEVLELKRCYIWHRTYHFSLGDGWTIAIRPESAGRFRVEGCRWCRPVATLWSLAADVDRLAGVVRGLREQIEDVHAGV